MKVIKIANETEKIDDKKVFLEKKWKKKKTKKIISLFPKTTLSFSLPDYFSLTLTHTHTHTRARARKQTLTHGSPPTHTQTHTHTRTRTKRNRQANIIHSQNFSTPSSSFRFPPRIFSTAAARLPIPIEVRALERRRKPICPSRSNSDFSP